MSALNKLFPGEPIFTMTTWDGKLMCVPKSMAESFQKEQEKLKAKAEAGELPEEKPINDELWNKIFSDTPLTDDEYDELFGESSATKTDLQKQSHIETDEVPLPTNKIHPHNNPSSYKIYKQNDKLPSKCICNKIINIFLIIALFAQLLFFTPYTLSKVEISKQNVPHYVKMFTVFRSIFFGESGYSEGTIRYVYELDYKRFIFQIAVTVAMYFTVKWFIKQKNET